MDIGWIYKYEEVSRLFWGLGLTDSVSVGESGYAEIVSALRERYSYPVRDHYEVGEVAYELLTGELCEALIDEVAECVRRDM